MDEGFHYSFSFSSYPSGASARRSQISSSHEAADLGMERGDSTSIYPTERKVPSKSKKQSSRTPPLKNKKNSSVASPQSSDTEESDYEPEDHTQWQSSDTEESDYEPEDHTQWRSNNKAKLDNDTKDSAIAKMDSLHRAFDCGMALSTKPEQTRSKNVRNGGSGHTPYIPDHSTACQGHLHCAVCRDMFSSSKPEQTRSKNVRNGGSGHTPYFSDDSNRPSTIINGETVNILNYSPTINLGGHTFNQNAGSGDSRQYQAVNVSGGTVTQGNLPFAGGGAAKYGR